MIRGTTSTSLPTLADELDEDGAPVYPVVFTEVAAAEPGTGRRAASGALRYTAVIGDTAHIDHHTGVIKGIENRLDIMSIGPRSMYARAYEGLAAFYQAGGIYFTVVFPTEYRLADMQPALRWRFRFAFEYPRRRKKGFLVPTISSLPPAYCFLSEGERSRIEHLCPPIPIARYIPEEFGYDSEEMATFLQSEEQRQQHLERLYPLIEAIFQRTAADPAQYLPMSKELIPVEFRDYELLYDADMLGGW